MTNSINHVMTKCPYVGLRYYEDDEYFAGRDSDARKFLVKLNRSPVLILHGRSGCGKSSFLRAGVRPYLQAQASGYEFNKKFDVIRSSARPLSNFITHMFELIDLIAAGETDYGEPRGEALQGKAFAERFEQWRKMHADGRLMSEPEAILDAMKVLSRSMRSAPIFVIDQAEEVFTLEGDSHVDSENLLSRDREEALYFDFLNMAAERKTGCKIVVSLRTEYKGRFDDELANAGRGTTNITGFFLEDLDEAGIIAAIMKPTEERDKNYPFTFHEAVPAELARMLLDKNKTLPGGVLPTLQVACRRLWRMTRESARYRGAHTLIARRHLRQIGSVESQIEEYLSESIDEACQEHARHLGKFNDADASDTVHRSLNNELVKSEIDGRMVTRKRSMDQLLNTILDFLPQEVIDEKEALRPIFESIILELAEPRFGVLRQDDQTGAFLLGHDSVALALNKWKLIFNRNSMAMMRMTTQHNRGAADMIWEDLFTAEEKPEKITLHAAQDYYWDRQLPLFARDKGFAQRLGFEIIDPPAIDATSGSPSARNWVSLTETIIETGKKLREDGNEFVLVPSEWSNFPGAKQDSGKVPYDRNEVAPYWSDLLVTNIFAGNAIIGEPIEELTELWDKVFALRKNASHAIGLIETYREIVEKAIDYITDPKNRVQIVVYGEHGRQTLMKAAQVVGKTPAMAKFLSQQSSENEPGYRALATRDFSPDDPLLKELLDTDGDSEETTVQRYVLGSSFTRAMAMQAGYNILFGSEHLMLLAQQEMQARINGDEIVDRKQIPDVAKLVQEMTGHTVWQVSIPPGQWRQGHNRARMLRLAALGYFTVEQARSNPDSFALHLSSFLRDAIQTGKGDNAKEARGMRISRPSIRRELKDGFDFFKFDENSSEFFDLDSLRSYWSDHAKADSRSIAGEVYIELVSLRRKALDHFARISEAVATLRYEKAYDPANQKVQEAYHLKMLAWNNFRIMNFYDAERYMLRAADKFEAIMNNSNLRNSMAESLRSGDG